MYAIAVATVATLGSLLVPLVAGFSFSLASTPQQCQNLTISITGSGGQPPYRALIIPVGGSPTSKEVRKIIDVNFTANSNSVSFKLPYPTNSGFVTVVSDSSAFGSGGTSGTAYVQQSSDASCFDANTQVSPAFVYSIVPGGFITQCQPTRIWWDPATETQTPNFYAVVPAGNSIAIPQGALTTVPEEGRGFNWTVNIKSQETVILVAGDSRGSGVGGSTIYTVQEVIGSQPAITTCLTDSSPSHTPGDPAGGSYPTQTGVGTAAPSSTGGSSGSSGGGGSSPNIGAIVGGVIGGIIAILILLAIILWAHRRSKKNKYRQSGAVDLADNEDEEGPHNRNSHNPQALPEFYQPEPFLVPDPSETSRLSMSDRRMSSMTGTTSDMRAQTPDGLLGAGSSQSQGTRKSPLGPSVLRPVNIFQHDDAPDQGEEGAETIELPPAYNKIKTAGTSTAEGSGSATAT